MNKADVIIVGSGLVGSATSKFLNKKGLTTLMIDETNPLSASKCSFGVFKPTWINEKIKTFAEAGMDFLDEMCDGIQTIEFFNMKKEVMEQMSYVDCSKILNEDVIRDKVVFVNNKSVKTDKDEFVATKAVVLATGAFTDSLLKISGYKNFRNLDKCWGATLDVKSNIDSSRISEWAPYKQNVLLKINEKKFVFGDGATVKNPKTSDLRIEMASVRLIQHLQDVTGANIGIDKITAVNEGLRPYLSKGYSDYIVQHDKNLFSATGGAKNTTILCSYMAKELYQKIKTL